MYCPACGHEVEVGQKFCQDCGRSLSDVGDAPEAFKITPSPTPPAGFAATMADDPRMPPPHVGDAVDDVSDEIPNVADLPTREITPRPPIPDPDWATPTGDLPAITTEGTLPGPPPGVAPDVDVATTTQLPAQPVASSSGGGNFPIGTASTADSTTTMDAYPGGNTDEFPALFDGSSDIHEYPVGRDPFRLKLVFVFAFFGAIAVLMSAVADIIDIRTSAPVDGIATGVRTLDTLGTNLAVAGFIGATVMALGGLLACFGFRWGAGLAGGAGLALAGWSAMVVGLAELRVASAQSITRQTTDVAFTLKITRDLGFWLVVAVAAIGVLVFIASLRSFGSDGRPALNPWIAALGAVAGVVLVAGPLLPEGNATFNNNFRSATATLDLPAAYFAGRLTQLALIGFTVVFGLLIVRAYGLGFAAGGVSVAFWMWLSSLADLGTFPLGIAAGNFGAGNSAPHAVTTVGMVLTVFMLLVAAALATAGSRRGRSPHAY